MPSRKIRHHVDRKIKKSLLVQEVSELNKLVCEIDLSLALLGRKVSEKDWDFLQICYHLHDQKKTSVKAVQDKIVSTRQKVWTSLSFCCMSLSLCLFCACQPLPYCSSLEWKLAEVALGKEFIRLVKKAHLSNELEQKVRDAAELSFYLACWLLKAVPKEVEEQSTGSVSRILHLKPKEILELVTEEISLLKN
jgi:hypothetical protein